MPYSALSQLTASMCLLTGRVAMICCQSGIDRPYFFSMDEKYPVSVQVGDLLIEEPRAWLAFCVVLFVVCFPVYLAARRVAA